MSPSSVSEYTMLYCLCQDGDSNVVIAPFSVSNGNLILIPVNVSTLALSTKVAKQHLALINATHSNADTALVNSRHLAYDKAVSDLCPQCSMSIPHSTQYFWKGGLSWRVLYTVTFAILTCVNTSAFSRVSPNLRDLDNEDTLVFSNSCIPGKYATLNVQ